MHYGPPDPSSPAEAEYYFQELIAQRLRAKLLFHGDLADDESPEDVEEDYFAYYAGDIAR